MTMTVSLSVTEWIQTRMSHNLYLKIFPLRNWPEWRQKLTCMHKAHNQRVHYLQEILHKDIF